MQTIFYYIQHINVTYIMYLRITILCHYTYFISTLIIQDCRRSVCMHQKHTHASKYYNIFLSVGSANNFSKGSRPMRLHACGPRVISVSVRMWRTCLRVSIIYIYIFIYTYYIGTTRARAPVFTHCTIGRGVINTTAAGHA